MAESTHQKLIVVHGAGSFGHPLAKKYAIGDEIQDNLDLKKKMLGFSLTQHAVKELNGIVSEYLRMHGTLSVSIQPSSFILTKNKRIKSADLTLIKRYLEQVCLSSYTISLSQWLKYEAIRRRILNSSCIVDKSGFLFRGELFLDHYQYSDEALAAWEYHTEFQCPAYADYQVQVTDLMSFVRQNSLDKYLATATLYYEYIINVGIPPSDLYKWQLMMEVFIEELGPLALELIPGGVGDLIGAYNDYSNGNYWSASLSIVLAVVPYNEIKKVWDKAPDIQKGFKACYKIVVLWNKILTSPGGQKVLNKMPQTWRNLPGSKLAETGKGLKWIKDGSNEIRIMEAVPNSQYQSQRVNYVRLKKGGSYLDINGNPVPTTLPRNVPNPNFQELTHLPLSVIDDNLLELFFN